MCMRILVYIIFLFMSMALSAQKFYNVGVEEGLSSYQAYDIVQDKNGFIWVSTKVGIDRFDGENIVNYGYPGDDGEITFQIVKLITDLNKNIWAFTSKGQIFSFDEGNNHFQRIFSLSDSIQMGALINLKVDTYTWFCTGNGLWLYDSNERKIREVTYFSGKRVSLVASYSDDKYLVAASGELFEFNLHDETAKSIVSINYEDNSSTTQSQSVCWNKPMNEIWIGTNSGDVLIYNTQSKSIINLKDKIPELPGVPVFKVVASSNNEMYLGSDGGGVYKIDGQRKILLDNYNENEDKANTLVGNGVQDLFLANSGDLYISTFTGGLNILSDVRGNFGTIRHETNNPNSLRNNVVNNILEDSDGDLWFATNNGVSCWLKQTNKWIHFFGDRKQVANVFLSLCQYDKNTVIAGSYGKGVYFLSKKEGIKRHLNPGEKNSKNRKQSDYIVEIFKDNENRVWTGDTFNDMAVFNPKNNSIKYISLIGVKSIQAKDEHNVFVGTSSGVYILNTKSFSVQKVQLGESFPQQIFVNSLNFDREKQALWIATSGLGLLKFNVSSNTTEHFDKSKGLPSNHIYAILTYDDNILWASSEKGLFRYNTNDAEVEVFSVKDGLSDDVFYKNSRFKSQSGVFYFGSYNGVTYFNPASVEYQDESASIFLEELLINNKKYNTRDENSPLINPLNQTENLVLRYNQSSFSIGFTTISAVNSGEIQYSWILEGQDEHWSIPSLNKRANYTNVGKGDFQFRLRALSKRTGAVIDERLINITVKPAPWDTLWAKALLIFISLNILVFIFLYLRVSDKKKLSDAKIQFFTNTAHDIKTPLTLAMAPLGDLQKSKNLDDKDRYLLDLSFSNVSSLSNTVNHLFDFQKSDMGKNQLVLSKENIIKLVNDRFNYFNQLAEKKNIKFECVVEPKILFEWIDISKLEKVLDNLLSNSFKYTKENGEIVLRLSSNQSEWFISVKDSGIGIPQLAQKSLFKRYYRGENAINSKVSGSGIGLLLAKNYVLLHKGNIQFNSKEGVGTEFVISFKKGKEHYGENVSLAEITVEKSSEKNKVEREWTSADNKKKRIEKLLIVEDNDKLRNYLANTLSEHYQTFEAEDGIVALKKVELVQPDLIVSDIGMPKLNGIELTEKLKVSFETSHIPIILLTAFDENKDIIKGLQSGADDYVTKPFDTSILIARIENILKNRQKIKKRFIAFSETKIEKDTFSNKKDQEFIEKAIAFVEQNITEYSLSKDHFAKEMFVSESLLYKKLKALTGQSPSEFIKTIRLKKAMGIIQQGEKSISEVAELTGFSDSKYFSTSFKKFYGKPPSSFV